MKQIPTLMEHKRSNLGVIFQTFLGPNSPALRVSRGLDMVILVQHQRLQQVRGEGNLMPQEQ